MRGVGRVESTVGLHSSLAAWLKILEAKAWSLATKDDVPGWAVLAVVL